MKLQPDRGNQQALAAKPRMGETHSFAFGADAVLEGHGDILEAQDGMMVIIGVGIGRRALDRAEWAAVGYERFSCPSSPAYRMAASTTVS